MAKKNFTVVTCDRCGADIDTQVDMLSKNPNLIERDVSIVIKKKVSGETENYKTTTVTFKDLCQKCLNHIVDLVSDVAKPNVKDRKEFAEKILNEQGIVPRVRKAREPIRQKKDDKKEDKKEEKKSEKVTAGATAKK